MKNLLVIVCTLAAATLGLAQHDHGSAPAPAAPAATTQTVCPVSGEKLGEMGKPVTYVYKQDGKPDRTILFCCKNCIRDFEKDPSKYLAKLDAASAPAKSEPAKHDHAARSEHGISMSCGMCSGNSE